MPTDTTHLASTVGLCAKAGAVVCGTPLICEALRKKNPPVLVLLASDAAKNTVDAMHNAAAQREEPLPILRLPCTKKELGSALGVRECAAVAVLDTGFALALCKKLEQAELIASLEQRLAREKKRKAKKEARKEAKKEPQAPAGARTSGAVRRIAEKKGNPGSGKTGSAGAKRPAEGRNKSPRAQKPRVTGKRGN